MGVSLTGGTNGGAIARETVVVHIHSGNGGSHHELHIHHHAIDLEDNTTTDNCDVALK